jgi:hypothetical protein
MAMHQPRLKEWLRLICTRFDERPDLQMTQPQVEAFWGLEAVVAEGLLSALVSAGYLKRTLHGTYVSPLSPRTGSIEENSRGQDGS